MDFKSLSRRELQSLCKLNKIPANITNVAMADALNSLETVVGIEDILNALRSETAGSSIESAKSIEVTSPRVPRTNIKTSNWKKVKTESVLATASRASHGVRRQLTGEGNEFMKTPSISLARPKKPTTVTKETTVQRVYNTRRSARLTEKKCAEAGVTERDISRPVKIASFLEEVSVTSNISAGSDSCSLETSHESNPSFEITEDDVGEGSVENCDEGTSKAKVEDMRIEFEKLDVIVDGSDKELVIEKGDCCDENVYLKEKHKVEEKFIFTEHDASEEEGDQVDNVKSDLEDISNPCEDDDSKENIMVVNDNIDPYKVLDVTGKEHLAPKEQVDSLLCDKVLSGENNEKVNCCGENVEEKQKVEEKFKLYEVEASKDEDLEENSSENEDSKDKMMEVDGKIDPRDALNVSVNEEHIDSLLYEKVLTGENNEMVDCCGDNVDFEENQKVREGFIVNEVKTSKEKSDNAKPNSKVISILWEDKVSKEKLIVTDEIVDSHDELNVSVKEHLALEEHFHNLPRDKVLSGENSENVDYCGENVDLEVKQNVEEKFILNEVETFEENTDQVNGINSYSKGILNSYEIEDSEKKLMVVDEKVNQDEALNVSVKEYLDQDEHSNNLARDKILSGENSEKVDCCGENVDLEEKDTVEDECILNELETSKIKGDQLDNIKQDSEDISNPSEDEDLEEKLIVVDENIDPHETLNVSVREQNVYLASEEHIESLLYDKVSSEENSSDADIISCDTEDPNNFSVFVLEIKKEILENGSTCNNENPSDPSKLENVDNYDVANETTVEPTEIEDNISTYAVNATFNEEELSKDYETHEEPQVSLIKETVSDTTTIIYQETEENQFSTNAVDVTNLPTHSTLIKTDTLNNEISAGKVQVVTVEDDKFINKEAEDEKPLKSLNDSSIRQLKKQLKALSIKNNLNTNKDDQVVESRSVLQAMCDNHLATGEEM